MRRLSMDITAGKREPRADGELMGRAGGTAQNDFGGENVAGKPREGGDLYAQEFTERAADPQMMGCDMEWDVFHNSAGIAFGFKWKLGRTVRRRGDGGLILECGE
jgi:hypothetical protein